jgi:hypothetical protein
VVSGEAGPSMEWDVLRAREWVLANQAAILEALASEHESEVRGSGENDRIILVCCCVISVK